MTFTFLITYSFLFDDLHFLYDDLHYFRWWLSLFWSLTVFCSITCIFCMMTCIILDNDLFFLASCIFLVAWQAFSVCWHAFFLLMRFLIFVDEKDIIFVACISFDVYISVRKPVLELLLPLPSNLLVRRCRPFIHVASWLPAC